MQFFLAGVVEVFVYFCIPKIPLGRILRIPCVPNWGEYKLGRIQIGVEYKWGWTDWGRILYKCCFRPLYFYPVNTICVFFKNAHIYSICLIMIKICTYFYHSFLVAIFKKITTKSHVLINILAFFTITDVDLDLNL